MNRAVGRNAHLSGNNDEPQRTMSVLWVLTPLAATFSVGAVIVAMLTNQWLLTEEKMNNPSYNGTGEKDYLSKMTISGLWMFCFTNPGETLYECSKIDYFTKEEYSPDPNDSTLAIPYAVTRSVIFFVVASLLLCGGYCCCIMGHCVKHRTLYTFISGVIFVVTGLIMLTGLIMYISIFKAEIGGKLRPRSQLQPPAFTYSYGYSFLLYIVGFVTTQLAGVCALFLFIYRKQYDWKKKYQSRIYREKGCPPPPTFVAENSAFYPCRRHPQAYINTNSIHIPTNYPSPVQRRYCFRKEPHQESPCSIHRNRSQSNSLKDVSTFYDFPPPPTISYQFEEQNQYSRGTLQFPRDATTNTVSTSADITCDDYLPDHYDDFSPTIQHEHNFVTFDLDQPLPLRSQSTASINSKNGKQVKYTSDTLRRTTPV